MSSKCPPTRPESTPGGKLLLTSRTRLAQIHRLVEHDDAAIAQRVESGYVTSLEPGSDPLRIGRTALVTFSPLGSSSSGTLYVAAHRGPQMAIRLYGASGRVRVLMFDTRSGQWRP